jgi:hypothetical protein
MGREVDNLVIENIHGYPLLLQYKLFTRGFQCSALG